MHSELGLQVAAEMGKILDGDQFGDLFYHEKTASKKCTCDDDCKCKKDGKCTDCPCEEPKKAEAAPKCKCPKDCKKCDCSEKTGECKCLKKAEALQDLCYTFSKVSADLDEAGYVQASVAVLNALDCLIAEATPADEREYQEATELVNRLQKEAQLELVPDQGPEMDWADMGAEVVDEKIDEIKDLIDAGKYDEAEDLGDALFALLEDDKMGDDVLPEPPTVEDLDLDADLMESDLDMALAELDSIIGVKKTAQVNFVPDPELQLDLDLKDLLAADDGVDSQLIEGFLSDLDTSFEDED